MQSALDRSSDPKLAVLALCWVFLALCLFHIQFPSKPFFDEVHYLPAARALLDGSEWLNAEHPPLGKIILAAGIALFGDNPFGWRIFPAIFGTIALYAFTRALWEASESRFATLAYCWLLGTGFFLIIHGRIAMLDIFLVAFIALALWQCARAVRAPEEGRRRLILAGLALGAALATKWNAIPLAPLPGLAFLFARIGAGRRRLLLSRRGAPVPGVSLAEAAVWLGLLPLAVYALSFAPTLLVDTTPFGERGLIGIQQMMLEMQESVKQPHHYQSNWWQWILNLRGIWYLYEDVDGAYRGVLLIGNPFTMLVGLPALLWCGWVAVTQRRHDALAVTVLFAASFGFWIVAAKPIQFYYHYFLPSCFLLAALALALDELRQRGWGWASYAILAASAGFFVFFFPVLTAMKLTASGSFITWAWIDGWL
jgi:dolichyl-phosphate-mannose--protein O-mannosyl transferase